MISFSFQNLHIYYNALWYTLIQLENLCVNVALQDHKEINSDVVIRGDDGILGLHVADIDNDSFLVTCCNPSNDDLILMSHITSEINKI